MIRTFATLSKTSIIAVVCAMFFPLVSFAGTTGFTTETIVFDKVSIIEGEEVSLTVSFINEEEKRLTGKINFYNNDQILGGRELNLDGGQAGEFIVPWVAALGEHSFVAKAEQLKLEGSSVAILGPSTEPKKLLVGFKNSSVSEQLRAKGGFGKIVAGVWEEAGEFFVPIVQSIDTWRISKIDPFSSTKIRVDGDKENSEGKMKPLLVIHSLALSALIFVFLKKVVFFTILSLVIVWIFVRIIKLFRYIIRRKYDQE